MDAESETDHVQDPMFPPNWIPWKLGDTTWLARPPGRPNPIDYVRAETKEDCADKAWYQYRKNLDAAAAE